VTKGGRLWCTRGRSGWIQLLDEQNKMKGRESGGGRRERNRWREAWVGLREITRRTR